MYYVCIDGWMDGWKDVCVCVFIHIYMDGKKDGWTMDRGCR